MVDDPELALSRPTPDPEEPDVADSSDEAVSSVETGLEPPASGGTESE